MPITAQQAEDAIAAAVARAVAVGMPMHIAVLDGAGRLKAFARMEGTGPGSIEIASRKARTAMLFGLNTGAGPICLLGGIPLRSQEGEVIGGVGVSGGAFEQDCAIALVAAAAASA